MRLSAIRNMYLRSLVEAADEDKDEKKENEEEEEKEEDTKEEDKDTEEENTDEKEEGDEEQQDDETEENDSEESEGDEPASEDGEAPAEGEEGSEGGDAPEGEGDAGGDGSGDDGLGEFSLDGDDNEEEDLGPAPDGLPEADDDGSDDTTSEEEDGETNLQVNVLKLSKLDRVLAKRMCYQHFTDLRSTLNANIGIIDKNEAVIDADVREIAASKLNRFSAQVDEFLRYKFPTMNYEEALQAYFVFVREINEVLEYVKNDGIAGSKSKHKNKGRPLD